MRFASIQVIAKYNSYIAEQCNGYSQMVLILGIFFLLLDIHSIPNVWEINHTSYKINLLDYVIIIGAWTSRIMLISERIIVSYWKVSFGSSDILFVKYFQSRPCVFPLVISRKLSFLVNYKFGDILWIEFFWTTLDHILNLSFALVH